MRTSSRSSGCGRLRVRPRSTSSATVASASSPAPASTPHCGTRGREVPRHAAPGGCGAGFRNSLPMISIGGYYGTGIDIASEIADVPRARPGAGMKFKVRGRPHTGGEDAKRFREARQAERSGFCSDGRRESGLVAGRCCAVLTAGCGRGPALVRGALSLGRADRRAMRDVRPGVAACARLRRAERVLGRRLPRPDGGRGNRRLQLRLLMVGRTDGVAPRRRDGTVLRRRDGAPRGAAGRLPSFVFDSARNLHRVLSPRPRSNLVEPDRQPTSKKLSRMECSHSPTIQGSAGCSMTSTSSTTAWTAEAPGHARALR